MGVDVSEMGADGSTQDGWCETLYNERAAGLLLYGRALGLSHSESEDVLQETFISLLKLPHPPDEPLHYCLRSFRNRALNYHRGLWRRLAREFEFQRWFDRDSTESDQERAAMRCLKRLPAEQCEVIVLKIWNQHTFEEIGNLLGLSPNTVAGRYRYGIQKLRQCLRGNYEERFEVTGSDLGILDAASAEPGS
jgi:RNA polymerase sigma-70 factor (ECF subfamily)